MDEQLKFIIEQFEKNEINYWIDSGTLLGLVRDGKLIEGDNDIDVGVWETEINKIENWLPVNLSSEQHNTKKYFYGNKVYKIKIEDNKNPLARTIDINIFRKTGDFAYCPQILFKENRKFTVYFAKAFVVFYRYIINKFWNNIYFEKIPFNFFVKMGSWYVPAKFFNNLSEHSFNAKTIKFPCKTDEYLKLRYGNWKSPQKKWNFQTDDGAILSDINQLNIF